MNFVDALDRGNAITFKQQLDNQLGLFDGQIHAVKNVRVRLRKRARALLAAKPLKTIPMLPKAGALNPATMAGHVDLDLSSGQIHNERGREKSLPSVSGRS